MLNLLTKTQLTTDGDATFTQAHFSPDGLHIAVAQSMDVLIYSFSKERVGEVQLATRIPTNHSLPISVLTWSPDGSCIATGSNDSSVQLNHLTYGNLHSFYGHTAPITCLKFTGRGNLLISSSIDESIKIWDVLRGTILRTINAHSDPVVSIDLSNDSTMVSSGSHDGLVRLYDTASGNCLRTLTYDKDWKEETGVVPVGCVIFAPNSRYLLVRSLDLQGTIKIWDCLNTKVLRTLKFDNIPAQKERLHCGTNYFVNPTDNNLYVIAGFEQGQLLVWDTKSKQVVFQNDEAHKDSPILSIDMCENLVVTLSIDGKLAIWEHL